MFLLLSAPLIASDALLMSDMLRNAQIHESIGTELLSSGMTVRLMDGVAQRNELACIWEVAEKRALSSVLVRLNVPGEHKL